MTTTYRDSVDYLYALGNELKPGAKWDLARMRELLEVLGQPESGKRFVHVAGTNGKGSVSAMIAAALRASGYDTGLYTSPHLLDPTERIRRNGTPVNTESFGAAFKQVHRAAERFDAHPSYFETITAMAFLLLSECEVSVIEVGLGGRLDATNVIEPALTVITPVSFDHESYLGTTLRAIASEKAGIIKAGVPLVLAPQDSEAHEVIATRAADCSSQTIEVAESQPVDVRFTLRGCQFRLDSTVFSVPLAGRHQLLNALTAIAACRVLGLSDRVTATGIAGTRWPGRLDYVHTQPDIVLDGAHNPAGAAALASYIREFCTGREVWMIYGTMRDKAIAEIDDTLLPLAHRLILTAPDMPRALRPEALKEALGRDDATVAPTLTDALSLTKEAPQSAIIFVTGSLFLVGEAYATLGLRPL